MRQFINRAQSSFVEAIISEAFDIAENEDRPPGERVLYALNVATYSYRVIMQCRPEVRRLLLRKIHEICQGMPRN